MNRVIDFCDRLPKHERRTFLYQPSLDTLLPERGGNDDIQISNRNGPACGGRHRTDWLLFAEQEPPLGSHLVTPRLGYMHHGIYAEDGKVVHYAGLAHSLRRG